jgi:hypothetical protein
MAAFERKELQEIITKAAEHASIKGLNPMWKRAYEDLAFAAAVLDAFLARSTSNIEEEIPLEKYLEEQGLKPEFFTQESELEE